MADVTIPINMIIACSAFCCSLLDLPPAPLTCILVAEDNAFPFGFFGDPPFPGIPEKDAVSSHAQGLGVQFLTGPPPRGAGLP